MKSAVIHIGPHKTGSTYLQACFAHYREELRAKGIIVPKAWEHAPGNASHSGLALALREGGDLAKAAEVLEREFATGGTTLLVSAEDLSSLNEDAVRRLRSLLGESAVTIVYYARRWSDLLPSSWQELVKQGYSMTFPEYLAANLRNPESSHLFSLDMRLRTFAEVFGKESIKIVCYSALRDTGVDLFVHFAKRFLNWWQAEPLADSQDVNRSRDPLQIELLRILNVLEFERIGERSSALRSRLDAVWESIDTRIMFGAMELSRTTILFNDAFPGLRRLHVETHQRYLDNVVKPGPPDLFFRLSKQEIPYVAADYLVRPGVADAVRALFDRLVSNAQ